MRSASNCLYPAKLIFPSEGFSAHLSVTVLVQQLLQKLSPPLDDAQNKIVALGVSRRQMPSVHKAMDVALSLTSCFKQCIDGRAFVDVFSEQLPPLHLTASNWVVRKFWCTDQCVEIVGYASCVQCGFSEQ